MAGDSLIEYWAEILARTPVSPEVMAHSKRVLDHSIEAWSRALSEVMATDDFAQLLGISIEQWLKTQTAFTGNPAPPPVPDKDLTGLAAEVRRLDDRLRQLEQRIGKTTEPAARPDAVARRRPRRRRAA
jgi:hypothetical protein